MVKLSFLRCPRCKHKVSQQKQKIICRNCKTQYKIKDGIPVFQPEKTKEKLEKTSPEYWERVWQQNNIKQHLKSSRQQIKFYLKLTKMFKNIISSLNQKKNISVMELGCGGSQFLPYFMETLEPIHIGGIDRSYQGCRLTLDTLQQKKENSTIVCSDIFSHPFKPEKFDFVYSFGLVHHFLTLKKALEIHAELLKPGGTLVCVFPNLQGIPQKFFDILKVDTMVNISIEDMKAQLTELGLSEISVKPVGGLHPLLMLAQSYRPPSHSLKEEFLFFFYRYVFGIPLLILNLPFLFRLNHVQLSPFIMATAKK